MITNDLLEEVINKYPIGTEFKSTQLDCVEIFKVEPGDEIKIVGITFIVLFRNGRMVLSKKASYTAVLFNESKEGNYAWAEIISNQHKIDLDNIRKFIYND